MRIVCLSDLHSKIDRVKVPPGDILLIAGDLTMGGEIKEYSKLNHDLEPIRPLYKHGILAIPGNHELNIEKNFDLVKSILTNVKYFIHHQEIIIEGIRFFGSGFSKWFYDWALNIRPGAESQRIWSQIPNDTEILITHGPPIGILDKTLTDENVGDVDLYNRIQNLHRLRLHVFGHIHPSAGFEKRDNVMYVNASTCNNKYQPINPPIVVEIDDTTHEVTNVYKYQE